MNIEVKNKAKVNAETTAQIELYKNNSSGNLAYLEL